MTNRVDEANRAFAKSVRGMRTQRRWTQAQLAARLTDLGWRVDDSAIARIETGDRKVSIGEAFLLADTLGISLAMLVDDSKPADALDQARALVAQLSTAMERL